MRRNRVRRILTVFLVAVLLAVAVLPLAGCGNDEDVSDNSGSTKVIEELPPTPDEPKTGHPKLDSRLNSLVDAEKRGEAESFAQSRLIDLVDGSVRVEIKFVSGQLEAAVRAAADLGTVEVVADKMELVLALIPITSLYALAEEESVRFIRVPIKGVPQQDG